MNMKLLSAFCLLAMALPSALRAQDDALDAELLEGIAPVEAPATIDGEDLGAPENPLERLAGRMRDAEISLRSARLGPPTQKLQQEIIADLDQLIADQEKKCQGGGQPKPNGSSKQGGQKPGGAKPGGPQPGAPKEGNQQPGQSPTPTGQQAAADSQDGSRSGNEAKTKFADPQDLLKQVWGHLPARMRDQMRQNTSERFLPKYEQEISDYFERLIDLENDQRSQP